MKNSLFRQSSLDRLSSPEELDNLMKVTSSRGWLALLGIAILVVSAILWATLGSLPTKLVAQQCILVKRGGVSILSASGSGRLSDLSVEAGDMVTRGQIVGRLEQSDLLQKIKTGEARLKEAQAQYDQALRMARQGGVLRAANQSQQAHNLTAQLESANRKAKLLSERVETQNNLLAQGLITKQTVIATQLDLTATQLEMQNIKAQVRQLELSKLEGQKQSDNELVLARNHVDDAQRALDLLLREAKNFSLIVSPATGKVLEVKAVEGQLVDRGTQLVSIEAAGADINEIEAYAYMPAADGKKIKAGMKVEVSPSTVKREEYGFLPAYITATDEYPSTDQGLMRIFGNEKVVKQLTGTSAPLQIVASLKPSASNLSHYEWSTRQGPPFPIQSGTLCSATITIAEQRPIALVLPILKRLIGA